MIGELIGAGLNLVGGLIGNRQAAKANRETNAANAAAIAANNEANAEAVKHTNRLNLKAVNKTNKTNARSVRQQNRLAKKLHGDSKRYSRANERRSFEAQKLFAKNSAGWQFDDLMEHADQAGIHRLAALGAAGASNYTPVGGAIGTPNLGATNAVAPQLDTAFSQAAQSSPYLGSGIGDGLSTAGNMFAAAEAQKRRETQQAADRAIAERVAASEIQRNEADAALSVATARTRLLQAQRQEQGGPGAANYARPDAPRTEGDVTDETVARNTIQVQTEDGNQITDANPEGLIGLEEVPHWLLRQIRLRMTNPKDEGSSGTRRTRRGRRRK